LGGVAERERVSFGWKKKEKKNVKLCRSGLRMPQHARYVPMRPKPLIATLIFASVTVFTAAAWWYGECVDWRG
jgi:hypothetical protein